MLFRQSANPVMEVLIPLGADGLVTMFTIRGDGVGYGVVEQPVESMEFLDRDRRFVFICQLGDRLADIPVIVDYLFDGIPLREQLFAMQGRGTLAFH